MSCGALFTDHYELTMSAAYLAEGRTGEAVFELFFRKLPPTRSYAVAAGIEDALDFLERFRFRSEEVDWLRSRGIFDEGFLERLHGIRFTGDVQALPEGTIVFENEPILQVVAPIVEAQLVETFLINQIHMQTVIASKAARVVEAAQGRTVIDFGCRRAHGLDAGLHLARCSYLVGATGTSLLEAGMRYGIPTFGTMAHSYIQAHDDESRAFEVFAGIFPGTTILVDTYDTLEGVRKVVELLRKPACAEHVQAIRIDSGDLAESARAARAILDEAGCGHVRIFVSSDLDEFAVARLVASGAPVDGFGVGTRMATSADAPTLDVAYKLVAYDGRGRTKLSSSKVIHPGRKQVFRQAEGAVLRRDVIGRHDEAIEGEPLLVPMMRGGRRLAPREPLATARERAARGRRSLPPALRAVETKAHHPVSFSAGLEADLEAVRAALVRRH
ncbi:nicotinate phosphoribosyltransferase [Vulgatibacter sp.]|uniref:nicotinate phosphoribosyltransferase n=1 Tax=Vulgatibacter sp. TaxID=1971226 RepID=UPI00356B605E